MMVCKIFISTYIIFLVTASDVFSQDSIQSISLLLGDKLIDKAELNMTKEEFFEAGKITTEQQGYHVRGFFYSTFALGKSVREYVADSIFPKSMKNIIFDTKYNYHHINLEQIEVYSENGKQQKPRIETVKIKFLNK